MPQRNIIGNLNIRPQKRKKRHRKMRRIFLPILHFFSQSGNQHNKLKIYLQNDFTIGNDRYPNISQATLQFLDKYSKSSIVSQHTSEGSPFSKKGRNKYQGGDNKTYDNITGRQKNASGVERKVAQRLIVQKAILKTGKKDIKRSDANKFRASRYIKSSKSDIVRLKRQIAVRSVT